MKWIIPPFPYFSNMTWINTERNEGDFHGNVSVAVIRIAEMRTIVGMVLSTYVNFNFQNSIFLP